MKKREQIEYIGETPDFIKHMKSQVEPKPRERRDCERDLDAVIKEDEEPQLVITDIKAPKIPTKAAKIEKAKKPPLTKKQIQKLKNKNLVSFE